MIRVGYVWVAGLNGSILVKGKNKRRGMEKKGKNKRISGIIYPQRGSIYYQGSGL